LEDTVEWSYTLLSPIEQKALTQLAVFVGGWTLEAMEQVLGEQSNCVPLLQQLVHKSLVSAAPMSLPDGRRTRYSLLRAIREYVLLRLRAGGEEETVRRRHFRYYAQLGVTLGDQVMGAQHQLAMARLDTDYHNIRAAVQFALARPELTDDRLRLAAALTYYWRLRNHSLWAERLAWLSVVSGEPEGCSPEALAVAYGALLSLGCIDPLHATLNVGAQWHDIQQWVAAADELLAQTDLAQRDARSAGRLLLGLADAHRFPGGLARCREYAERAVHWLRVAGDLRNLGFAQNILTWLDMLNGITPSVLAQQEANLEAARNSGSTWALCEAYRAQIAMANAGQDRDEAIQFMKLLLALAEQEEYLPFLYNAYHILERIDEALAVEMAEALVERQRRKGNSAVLGLALHQLGRIYVNTHRFAQAAAVLDEAIDFWRRSGGDQGPASALEWSLAERANAALCLGDFAAARQCCEESLALFVHAPFSDGSVWPRYYRACSALALGNLGEAAADLRACIRIVIGQYPGWEKLAIWSLAGLGEIAYRKRRLQVSGALFGAAAALDAGLPEPAARGRFGEVHSFLDAMAAASEYRQSPAFEQGWTFGTRFSLQEAASLALDTRVTEIRLPNASPDHG
jgi:tetratricopeptide (TPR) repeat protein